MPAKLAHKKGVLFWNFITLNTVFIIAFFIPGYIFIQTKDYFLLKREKTQFEKTIQGLIASVVIWFLFYLIKLQPLNSEKESIIKLFILFKFEKNEYVLPCLINKFKYIAILILLVCSYSFIFSCIISIIRKTNLISNIIQLITRRDYFERIEFRFFAESINETVVITMKNGKKYLGIQKVQQIRNLIKI